MDSMVKVEPLLPALDIDISGCLSTSCPLKVHVILSGRSPSGTTHCMKAYWPECRGFSSKEKGAIRGATTEMMVTMYYNHKHYTTKYN